MTVPQTLYATYRNQRWGAFLKYLEPFSKYLTLEWNRRHGGDEQISSIEIHYMRSYVGPPHVRSETTQELLWTQTF